MTTATNSQLATSNQTADLEGMLQGLILKYSDKYDQDQKFRQQVNTGLPVGFFRRGYMAMTRLTGMTQTYRASVELIITQYVQKQLEKCPDAVSPLGQAIKYAACYLQLNSQLKQIDVELAAQAETKRREQERIRQEKEAASREAQMSKDRIETEHQREKAQADYNMRQQLDTMKRQHTEQAKSDVDKKVRQELLTCGLIQEKKDQHGQTRAYLDDSRLVERLGDIFLEDVLDKVESRGIGMRAFLEGSQGVSFLDKGRLRDEAEISRIDPVASIIGSRMNGYDRIEAREAIVRKPFAEGTVDAVIALDVSGSMNDYQRIEIAKRTGLALDSMLRRQNPDNTLRYIVFGDSSVREVTKKDYYTVKANGDTPMAGAINMGFTMLEAGKAESRILYVISDCYPNVGDTVESARRFADRKDLYLRMILIGVDKGSVENVKGITEAAGKNSRILPVRHDKVDVAVFEDYYSMFSGLTTAQGLEATL